MMKHRFVRLRPNLVREWHPTKNGVLTPETVTPGSGKKVWWRCTNCTHEWSAMIRNRTRGTGCPPCSLQVTRQKHRISAVTKRGSLATFNPKIAGEWHPSKNFSLTPTEIPHGSDQVVWWLCSQGHEWEARIAHRARGIGCPICSGKKASQSNNLAVRYPDLAREWHSTKNGDLKPTDVMPHSGMKVWWQCQRGHEWQTRVYERYRKGPRPCPFCAHRRAGEDYNLAVRFPHIAKEWHPTKNRSLTPETVTPGSERKAWWCCERGHDWLARIAQRTKSNTGCPICSRREPARDKTLAMRDKNLAILYPALAAQWHPTKNGPLTPSDVRAQSSLLIWWRCAYGHDWQTRIAHRSGGSGCPFCSGRKACRENSLAVLHPALAKEWHPSKNGSLTPEAVRPAAGQKVWWQCQRGHEWQAAMYTRTTGHGCPLCHL